MVKRPRTVILIGGAPTTGKSTMAQLLAKHFDIPWISTDQVRELMRVAARREDRPDLFNREGDTAERFLTELSAEQIVDIELAQSAAVWPGIKKIIDDDYTWTDGFIIEGVNILPSLVAKDFGDSSLVRSVFLTDDNAERIRGVVFGRGLWDDASAYPDSVKEKEVEWVLLFNEQLKKDAKLHGYPCVATSARDKTLRELISIIEGGPTSDIINPGSIS